MTDTQTARSAGSAAVDGRPPSRQDPAPAVGVPGGLRFLWTQLTSMRTALALLFALAVAALSLIHI